MATNISEKVIEKYNEHRVRLTSAGVQEPHMSIMLDSYLSGMNEALLILGRLSIESVPVKVA